jgi:Fe2+ transport system protein B
MNNKNNKNNSNNQSLNQSHQNNKKNNSVVGSNSNTPSGWCLPTIVYVVLFVFSLVVNIIQSPYNNAYKNLAFRINLVSHHMLYGLIFTIILYLLCREGYVNIAWIVLLFPILLFILFYAIYILGYTFRAIERSV